MRKVLWAAGALGLGYLVWSSTRKAEAAPVVEGTWEIEDPESYSLFSSDPDEVSFAADDYVYFFLQKVDSDQTTSDVVMEGRAVSTKKGVVEVKDAKVARIVRGSATPPRGAYRVPVDKTVDPDNVDDIHTAQPK